MNYWLVFSDNKKEQEDMETNRLHVLILAFNLLIVIYTQKKE